MASHEKSWCNILWEKNWSERFHSSDLFHTVAPLLIPNAYNVDQMACRSTSCNDSSLKVLYSCLLESTLPLYFISEVFWWNNSEKEKKKTRPELFLKRLFYSRMLCDTPLIHSWNSIAQHTSNNTTLRIWPIFQTLQPVTSFSILN